MGEAHGGEQDRGGEDRKTRTTVLVALAANLVIAAAKAAGGLVAGSPALLSEAAHSVADSLNEIFLLASLKRSRRPADADHPFGYGKERYFWSLLAAVGIFVTGGCFSFFQGAEALNSTGSESRTGYIVGLAVLGMALAAESTSLAKAVHQVRTQARQEGRGTLHQIRAGRDPALRTVLAEDSTAVLGVLLAIAGMALHMATGSARWEAWASLGIAALLVYVAYRLGRDARALLIGEAADPALRQAVLRFLDDQPEVDTVTALLTMRLGMDSVLVAARTDLVGGLDSEEVEEVSGRIRAAIRERWPQADQIFLDIAHATTADRARSRREREALDHTVSRLGDT
jgi:cation diffusion facilitator family transporter